MGRTQFPIQCLPGAVSPGLIGTDVKLTTNLDLLRRSGIVELYLRSHVSLDGIMLNKYKDNFYGCETWSLKLRKEHKRVLRRIMRSSITCSLLQV
jgi:hypothetical protein